MIKVFYARSVAVLETNFNDKGILNSSTASVDNGVAYSGIVWIRNLEV